MLRKLFIAGVVGLIVPVTAAQAQVSLGIAAGASMPTGTTADALDVGYHLMATIGVTPPLAPVGFRVDGAFNEFESKPSIIANYKSRITSLTANAVISAPGVVVLSPYLIGGLGIYNSAKSPAGTTSSSTDMGFNLGGGIKFGLAGFGAFGEVRYHQIMEGGARFVPITFGVIF
jgi:hypothetical protein